MRCFLTWAVIGICFAGLSSATPRSITADVSAMSLAGLPTEQTAKTLLSEALQHRHPQWIYIPAGFTTIRSFVVFPDGGDNVPVVVITANGQGMTDWLRAVGDQAAQDGFIAVVPEHRDDAVTQWALNMPGSNGNGATVNFNFTTSSAQIETTIKSPRSRSTSFALKEHAWHNALAFLAGQTGAPAAPAARTRDDERANMQEKRPDLPANFLMAAKTISQSPRKGEWVDIPMASGTKLHTWISYPQGVSKAPVVLVFQPGPGMDMGEPPQKGGGANWLRAIADQLAYEGFIAVLPDLLQDSARTAAITTLSNFLTTRLLR